jgi:CRISPR-associated protein Csd2
MTVNPKIHQIPILFKESFMVTAIATQPIQHRCEFVLLFDVKNGNPNGDPDAGNAPRIDPETGHGLVSDVCLKRKIRNFVMLRKASGEAPADEGYDIYVQERAVHNQQHREAYNALKLTPVTKKLPKDQQKARELTLWMCEKYFDIRAFGAVMSTEINAGQVRGPVQIAFAHSVEPIVSLDQSITRCSVTNEKDIEKERTMGRKEIVPYALYRAHGFISPHLADAEHGGTSFNDDDLALLFQALEQMFEHDHSAARGEMSTCKLFVFEHASKLGNAPARKLFDLIDVKLKPELREENRPARSFADYIVKVNRGSIPSGVTLHERL